MYTKFYSKVSFKENICASLTHKLHPMTPIVKEKSINNLRKPLCEGECGCAFACVCVSEGDQEGTLKPSG